MTFPTVWDVLSDEKQALKAARRRVSKTTKTTVTKVCKTPGAYKRWAHAVFYCYKESSGKTRCRATVARRPEELERHIRTSLRHGR